MSAAGDEQNHPREGVSLRGIRRQARLLLERLVYGGNGRETLLASLLGALHRSQMRREWVLSDEPPHFYNQRWNGFLFTYGNLRNPYVFYRGFFASEILKDGDRLLDIGCGDGFFSNNFFSLKCAHIDAIDIEQSAIETAKRLNGNPKIDFYLLDATRDPFPSDSYDVIVWDGAIGHFSQSVVSTGLRKIASSLKPSGVFVGSESLGTEGSDHLQLFQNEPALASLFRPYFKHVWTRTQDIGSANLSCGARHTGAVPTAPIAICPRPGRNPQHSCPQRAW